MNWCSAEHYLGSHVIVHVYSLLKKRIYNTIAKGATEFWTQLSGKKNILIASKIRKKKLKLEMLLSTALSAVYIIMNKSDTVLAHTKNTG